MPIPDESSQHIPVMLQEVLELLAPQPGSVVVDGWFWITGSGVGRVSGEWDFRARGEPEKVGPQVGEGILWGWLELGRLAFLDR